MCTAIRIIFVTSYDVLTDVGYGLLASSFMLIQSVNFPEMMMKSIFCDDRPLHERRDTNIQLLDLTKPTSLNTIPFYYSQRLASPSSVRYSSDVTPESPDSVDVSPGMQSVEYPRSQDLDTPMNLSTSPDIVPATVFNTARTTIPTISTSLLKEEGSNVESCSFTNSPPKTPNTPSCYKKLMLKRYGRYIKL